MKRLILILLAGGFFLQSFGQDNCPERGKVPFATGERLSYELSYNWGFIWVDAGYVVFTVKDTLVNGREGYNFEATGGSYGSWDWFYKVRVTYESWTSKDLRPAEFHRKGQEGSHYYNREYHFEEDIAHYIDISEEGEKTEKDIQLPPCPFDVISAIYYCRSIDFDQYEEGEKIPINLLLDGNDFESYLRYIGKEKWTDPNTDVEYDCIVFKPYLIEGTVFDSGEKMTVYVINDENKIPVYIETKLVVGKGKVFLTGTSGLKN